ncbi:peptidase M50 [Cellulomonas hominis]|uniref:site-2 protease family protein n=1 Tax=Cellulomonas hominis TaxID=156981 RepID=UPI001C114646|nr:site-2 protease family protein [Cellulomonas hominis]MBU5424135.1 peptidase M50 [Cellulomonas hominis]
MENRTRGWVVGRVAGAPVILTPSSLLMVALIALVFAPTVRARAPWLGTGSTYVVALVIGVLLLVSILVHELAHGLTARSRGLHVQEYALTLIGGHTAYGGRVTPLSSGLVAVAGPLANLVLAVLFTLLARAVDPFGVAATVLVAAAYANGFVGLFNLVPGLPLDGGQVLESVVWGATKDRRRGTTVAGWAGRVVAVGFVAWVLLVPLLSGARPDLVAVAWGALVGAFLWSGAGQAIKAARTSRAVDALAVSTVGVRAVGVPATAVLAEADAARGRAGADAVVLLSPDGRPAAYVDPQAANGVPVHERAHVPLTAVSVTLPAGAVVDASLRGVALVQAVAATSRFAPVMAALQDGQVVALVRSADVAAALRS